MANVTRVYQTKYEVDNSQAISGINALTAAALTADAALEKLGKSMKALGITATPLGKATGAVATGMKDVAAAANAAQVGVDNATTAANANLAALNSLIAAAANATASLQGVATASQKAGNGMNGATGHAQGLSSSLMGISPASLIMREVREAVHALFESLKSAREYAEKTASENLKLRDSLRELKALKGGSETMDQTHAGVIDLMLKTKATKEEARDFDMMWEGTIPAARQKLNDDGQKSWQLNAKQEQELKEKVLALSVAKGVKPDVMAEVVGMMGLHQPIKSVDEGMGQAVMMLKMGNDAVGRISEVFTASKRISASMVAPDRIGPDGKPIAGSGGRAARSDAELFGLLSAATTVNGSPAAAATSMTQVWREAQMKDAGRKMGITAKDDYVTVLEKFKGLLDKGRAEGKGEMETLKGAGFNLGAANLAIIKQVQAIDVFRARRDEAAKGGDPRQADADIKAFQAQNPDRSAKATETAADFLRGKEKERYLSAAQAARGRLKAEHRSDTVGSNFGNALDDIGGSMLGMRPQAERQIDYEIAARILEVDPEAAKRFPELKHFVAENYAPNRITEILNQLPEETFKKVTESPEVAAKVQGMTAGQGGGAGGAAMGNAVGAQVPAVRAPALGGRAPAEGAAGAAGANGNAAGGAGAAAGGVASNDEGASVLLEASLALKSAVMELQNPFNRGLPDFGGGAESYRA